MESTILAVLGGLLVWVVVRAFAQGAIAAQNQQESQQKGKGERK